MNVLVFDIETVPDTDAGRRLNQLPDELSDLEVSELMFHQRRQQSNGSEFLPLYLHRVVAISAVFRANKQLKVWSLGEENSNEKEIIGRFFEGIERFTSTLVSWNGSGFDLPVLHYRALLHGVVAAKYWDQGEDDQQFRWNNYINRYHQRHLDLMDILALFNSRANAPLDKIASLLGFPGKMGMSGAAVWQCFAEGNVKAIRDYCETDVLNTYLVFLRYQYMRGHLIAEQYRDECRLLHDFLRDHEAEHMQSFLAQWDYEQSVAMITG